MLPLVSVGKCSVMSVGSHPVPPGEAADEVL